MNELYHTPHTFLYNILLRGFYFVSFEKHLEIFEKQVFISDLKTLKS